MKEAVYLYGTGRMAAKALPVLAQHREILGFVDPAGPSVFEGYPVCTLEALLEREPAPKVVLSELFLTEAAISLFDHGVRRFSAYNHFMPGHFVDIDLTDCQDLAQNPNRVTLIVEELFSSTNTLALKKLRHTYQTDLELVWLDVRQPDLGEHYAKLITSAAVAVNSTGYPDTPRQRIFQLWHGQGFKTVGALGKYNSEAVIEKIAAAWRPYRFVSVASEIECLIMGACYHLTHGQFEMTGQPRNDLLFCAQARENLARLFGRPLEGKLAFYMPTYRVSDKMTHTSGEHSGVLTHWPDYDAQAFNAFLRQQGLTLIVKYHPLDTANTAGQALSNILFLSDQMLWTHDLHLYEVLGAADIGITDYSSVYTDLLLLDVPFVFTPADYDQMAENRGFLLPYDLLAAGPKVTDMAGLEKALAGYVADPSLYAPERAMAKKLLHRHTQGGACGRVMDAMARHMKNPNACGGTL